MAEGTREGSLPPPPGPADADLRRQLERNLASVRARIRSACERAGRDPAEVTLVAVTKTVAPAVVRCLAEAGQLDFGENRVQEALAKIPACPPGLRWHLIGHLQKNKAGRAASRFDRIHSVDGLALAEALERALEKAGKPLPCLLEVNVSGEASKHGVPADQAGALAEALRPLRFVRLEGLMTMAPLDPVAERARPHFRALRALRDRLGLQHLSMGMSQDFEVAVEEGATMVRVGSEMFRDTVGVVGSYRIAQAE